MKCVFIKPPAPLHHIFLICVLYAFTTRQHTVVQQFYIFHLAFVPLRQNFQQNLWVCFNSLYPPPLVLLRLSTQFYISCGVANSNKFYETNPLRQLPHYQQCVEKVGCGEIEVKRSPSRRTARREEMEMLLKTQPISRTQIRRKKKRKGRVSCEMVKGIGGEGLRKWNFWQRGAYERRTEESSGGKARSQLSLSTDFLMRKLCDGEEAEGGFDFRFCFRYVSRPPTPTPSFGLRSTYFVVLPTTTVPVFSLLHPAFVLLFKVKRFNWHR